MKKKLLTFAGVLALLAVLGKFYAQPLMAQVRAALVQDRDNVGRNLYQQVNSCNGVVNPCVINFPAVPAGQRVVITQVSALLVLPTGVAPLNAELRGAGVFQFLPAIAVPANFSGESDYVVNQTVLASYDAGQVPEVAVFVPSSSAFTALASISGYMITIP